MEIKQYVLAVFSPTGGTLKVARAICKGTGFAGTEVDLCNEPELREIGADTLLIAAMPVYENRIREVALRRLSRLQGKNGPAVAVVVYGNRDYGDAMLELSDTLQESGYTVGAAGAFVAEHSIIRSIAAGRPDAEDLKQAEEFGAQAAAKVKAQDVLQNVAVPGDPGYKGKKGGTGVKPLTDENCISCGICAQECPVKAIPLEQPNTTTDACIGCMRCISVCPEHARKIPAPIEKRLTAYLQEKAAKVRRAETIL